MKTSSYATVARRIVLGLSVWRDGAVRVTVANTGSRTGATIVQLCLRHELASVVQRERELKAFQRVELPPGGCAEIEFPLGSDDFGIYDAAHRWVDERKPCTVFVGFDAATENGVTVCR